PKLGENVANMLFHRTLAKRQLFPNRAVRSPFGHQSEHFSFAWRKRVKVILFATAGYQLSDHFGIKDHSSRSNLADGLDERSNISHPLFQQIPDSLRPFF